MVQVNWTELSHLQIGKYAEYLIGMEFTKYENLSVFTAEVDDRGIDMVIRFEGLNKNVKHFDIQVKSFRQEKTSYVFIPEDKFIMNDTYLVALVVFNDNNEPACYLIPAKAWKTENAMFRYRLYDKPGQKSKPEYGLNVSRKNMHLLDDYIFSKTIKQIFKQAII